MGTLISAAVAKPLGKFVGGIGGGVAEGAGAISQYKADNPYLPQYLQSQIEQQNQIATGQNTLAQALQAQMAGTGPNPAQTQFVGNTQSNIANAQGLIASQRGLNPALAARLGANAAANANQQEAINSARMQQEQQIAATQNLQGLYAQMANANLGYQQNYRGAEQGQQQLNAKTAEQNAQIRGQIAGGIANAAAGAGSKMATGGAPAAAAHGGFIPGPEVVPGDSSKNDVVDAKLSAGEIVVPKSMAHNPQAAKDFIDALFKNSGAQEMGYGDVLKARNAKKKAEDSLKMNQGGQVPISAGMPPTEQDIERYKFQNPDSMDALSYQSAISGRSLGREFLGDTAAPMGSGEARPSWDAMDLLPPEKMGAAAISAGKALASHMAATKGAAGMLPLAAGAIRQTGTGRILGTVGKEAMQAGETGVQKDLMNQAATEGLNVKKSVFEPISTDGPGAFGKQDRARFRDKIINDVASDRGAWQAPQPLSESEELVNRVKARFGDTIPEEKWMALDSMAKKKNEAYFPIKLEGRHAGFYPNYDATPTGQIGNLAKYEGATPSKIFKDLEQLNWSDSKYGATKKLIEKHAAAGMPVNITTGTDLIAHDDYMGILPKGSKVNLVLSGPAMSDVNLGSPLPSNKRMLMAYDKLRKSGIDVSVYAPSETKGKSLRGLKQLDPFSIKKLQDAKGAYWQPSEAAE